MKLDLRGLLGVSLALGLGFIGFSSVIRARRFVTSQESQVPKPRPAPSASSQPRPVASVAASSVPSLPPLVDVDAKTLPEQREALFSNMRNQLGLSDGALSRVRAIFEGSRLMGQGNPKPTKHLMTRGECLERRKAGDFHAGDPRCGSPNMVRLFDPSHGETVEQARVCIDQYEFPNIVCEYPVVWVRADETLELCKAVGKRICDAHEWEGACAGSLRAPDTEYAFGQRRLMQEYLHNKEREIVWAYGKAKDHTLCATGARKSRGCYTPSWELCGTNTYPAGAFPACVSSLGVYDQHGNAAEHMNLPLTPGELASRGGSGETEMKGSWFIFTVEQAHEDDCRWRAPAWHAERVDSEESHRNYHLGFRCCKDLAPIPPAE